MEEDMIIKNGFRTPSFMTSPSNYTQSEIITMQQDAVKRVNEMRQQAMKHINTMDNVVEETVQETPIAPNIEQVEEITPTEIPEVAKEFEPIIPIDNNILHPTVNSLKGIFDKLDLDSEKIILIGLMLLLMNEGADNTLLMALGYVLL